MDTAETAEVNLEDAPSKKWLGRIKAARQREEKWRKGCTKIVNTYRDELGSNKHRINILWANTEILKPACYAPGAQPRVSRRFNDKDRAARFASIMLERVIISCLEITGYYFDSEVELAVQDTLLTGRGVVRCDYVPFLTKVQPLRIEGIAPAPEAEGIPKDLAEPNEEEEDMGPELRLLDEEVHTLHVHWRDFVCDDANHWREVRWVGFRHFWTKKQIKNEFPELTDEELEKISFGYTDARETGEQKDPKPTEELSSAQSTHHDNTAAVWEMWDKVEGKIVWVAEDSEPILKEEDPPFTVNGFFPCPEPLMFMDTGDTRKPVPEYTHYQSLASQVSTIIARMNRIVDAIRARGIYNKDLGSLNTLLSSIETELIPEENWNSVGQSLEDNVLWFPNEPLMKVLQLLFEQLQNTMSLIYEITGISDIMRGQVDPDESAAATKRKSKYSSYRLVPRQKRVERFVREAFEIQAEIIADAFDDQTILERSNAEALVADLGEGADALIDEGMQLLKDQAARNLRIAVESSDTYDIDDVRNRQDATELLQAIGQFYTEMHQLVASGSLNAEVANAILMFALRKFRVTRTLEDQIERSPLQPPQPQQDPKTELEKMKVEYEHEQFMQNMKDKAEDRQVRRDELGVRQAESQRRYEIEMAKNDIARIKAINSGAGISSVVGG